MNRNLSRGAAALLLAPLLAVASRCDGASSDGGGSTTTTPSGVQVTELVVGKGEPLADGDWFAVHYDARIAAVAGAPRDAPPYDSTRSEEPFVAKLGTSLLLPGFADGLRGMREGGRRRFVLPPATAHGAEGRGQVPPDATLEYDVDLVARFTRTASGLCYRVLEPGAGAPPVDGDRVAIEQRSWVRETGRTLSDTKMAGIPLGFVLGKAELVPGLDEALWAMAPHAKWQLALTPELAYGPRGAGWHLLPNQELLIDVQLLRVERPRTEPPPR